MRSVRLRILASLLVLAIAAMGGWQLLPAQRGENRTITVGTTDAVTSLDPAGAYDAGSWALFGNVFQSLPTFEPGGASPVPDAAQSCAFVGNALAVYRCTLRQGLTGQSALRGPQPGLGGLQGAPGGRGPGRSGDPPLAAQGVRTRQRGRRRGAVPDRRDRCLPTVAAEVDMTEAGHGGRVTDAVCQAQRDSSRELEGWMFAGVAGRRRPGWHGKTVWALVAVPKPPVGRGVVRRALRGRDVAGEGDCGRPVVDRAVPRAPGGAGCRRHFRAIAQGHGHRDLT